jgi:hypothetical protein
MRPSQRFRALHYPLFSAEPGDAQRRNHTDDHEVIELTSAKLRPRGKRSAMPALTLLGAGVIAREPERTVPIEREVVPPPTNPKLEIVDPADTKWQTFEDLGLAEPEPPAGKSLARAVVSAYRLLGFAILTLIVVVLVGYLVSTIFYFLSSSWIAPVAVSASDEKVVTARSSLLAQLDQRDRTAAELAQTERVIAAHEAFQREFATAIQGDRDGRKAALDQVRALAASAAATRSSIRSTTNAYAATTQDRMAKELEAGLIDRNTALAGKYQIAQIAGANLSIAERQAEYEARATELASQTRALEAIVSGKSGAGTLSYDVLRIKREYDASRLELAKARADRDVLRASLVRQNQTIDDVKQGAYLRALDDHASVALVPYANLEGVEPGAPVYACRLGFVVCRNVGSVLEVLRGEISFKHPRRDAMVRGQMVELRLDDAAAAQGDVLFVGGRPLGI